MTGEHAGQGASHEVAGDWPDQLAAALARQAAGLAEVLRLAELQRAQIESQDHEGLDHTLDRRQAILDRLTSEIAYVNRLRERFFADAGLLAAGKVANLRDAIARVDTLANEIERRDRSDRATLEHGRREVIEALRGVRGVRQAATAYAGRDSSVPRFEDREA